MAWFHRHPRRSFGVLLIPILGAAAAAVTSTVTLAQDNQFQLFIAPVDASGQPVTDLTTSDVMFAEAGTQGKVVTVERFNLPVRLTVAVDNGRESAPALSHYRNGLNALVETLPADVQMEIYEIAPQPRNVLRLTADREQIKRGITLFAPSDESPRFSEAMVEYAERVEKDVEDKKLDYYPVLMMVSTTSPETSAVQLDTIEDAFRTLVTAGARIYTAMTTTRAADQSQLEMLNNGRQAIIALQIVKATNGRYEGLADSRGLVDLLPKWGQELAEIHRKQTNQFRVVLERPAGATGPLNPATLDVRLTRAGLNASVSANGRYLPQ